MDTSDNSPSFFVGIAIFWAAFYAYAWIWAMRRDAPLKGNYEVETLSCLNVKNSHDLRGNEIRVRARKTVVVFARLIFSVLTVVYFAGLFSSQRNMAAFGLIIFGPFFFYCWRSNWVEAYVSIDGITPTFFLEVFVPKAYLQDVIIPWREVTSCQIITIHSKRGRFIRRYPVLKGSEGFLFRGVGSRASQEDLDRLINFIRGT